MLRLGRISASALFRKGEICVTVGQLKRVAPCDTRGHDNHGHRYVDGRCYVAGHAKY